MSQRKTEKNRKRVPNMTHLCVKSNTVVLTVYIWLTALDLLQRVSSMHACVLRFIILTSIIAIANMATLPGHSYSVHEIVMKSCMFFIRKMIPNTMVAADADLKHDISAIALASYMTTAKQSSIASYSNNYT